MKLVSRIINVLVVNISTVRGRDGQKDTEAREIFCHDTVPLYGDRLLGLAIFLFFACPLA